MPNSSLTLLTAFARFVSKFTEFTLLFVSKHLRRSQSDPDFPMEAFFGLLQRYTFGQPSLEGFMSCLDIYDALLDIMEDMEEGFLNKDAQRAMTTYVKKTSSQGIPFPLILSWSLSVSS